MSTSETPSTAAVAGGALTCGLSWSEEDRLADLRGYGILDTGRERTFDGIVKAAAFVCDAPIALINFIDRERPQPNSGRLRVSQDNRMTR
jgi:hypothetical protein